MITKYFSLLLLTAYALTCSGKPEFLVQTSPSGPASPGQTITLQVGLDRIVSGSQSVAIAALNSNQYSSLPSSVIVQDGDSTAFFQATLSTTASGLATIVVSANGESVGCDVEVEDSKPVTRGHGTTLVAN